MNLVWRKASTVVSVLALGLCAVGQQPSANAQPPVPITLNVYSSRVNNLSVRNLEMLGFDVPETTDVKFLIDPTSQMKRQKPQDLDDDLRRFGHDLAVWRQLNNEINGRAKLASQGTSYLELASDGDPITAFISKGLGTVLDNFNERLNKELEEAELESARNFWNSRKLDIGKLRDAQKQGVDAYVKEIENQSGLSDQIFKDSTPAEREIALKRLADFTLAASSITINELKAAHNRDAAKLSDLQKRVSTIEGVQNEVLKGQQQLLDEVADNSNKLNDISAKLDSQRTDLKVIQKMLFGNLSLQEQIKIVKERGALGLPEGDRAALQQNLEERKRIVDHAAQWNDFITGGKDALGILQKLGADPTLVQGLQRGLAASSALHGAVTSALSGNYLGATNAILGVICGGGLDAESARHAEIMGKLNEIVERQKQILAVQIKILEAINALAEMIWKNQQQILSALDNLYELEGTTLVAVTSLAQTPLNHCTAFRTARYDRSYQYLSPEHHFAHYAQMQDHFVRNLREYRDCRSFLDTTIGQLTGINEVYFGYPVIAAGAQEQTQVSALQPSFKKWVTPYYSYLDNFVPENKVVVESFFVPNFTYKQLKEKAQTKQALDLRPLSTANFPDTDPSLHFYYDQFRKFVSAKQVVAYAKQEMEINSYLELVDPTEQRLMTIAELSNRGTADHKGELRLESAFDWLTVAMAQQQMLAGDTLLPEFDKALFATYDSARVTLTSLFDQLPTDSRSPDLQVAHAQYLLGHNRLLLQNAIRYHIYSFMETNKKYPSTYAFAWNLEDPAYMNGLFGGTLKIERKINPKKDGTTFPTGWYMTYSYIEHLPNSAPETRTIDLIPMPSPDEVRVGAFIVTPDTEQLLSARNSVNELLAEYQAVEKLEKGNPNLLVPLKLNLLRHVAEVKTVYKLDRDPQ